MKLIKFDLPIDGTKVRTREELRDHFTPEILELYRTGLLAKWLASRQISQELSAIKAIEVQEDQALLQRLCEVFDIQADEDFIRAACATAAIIPAPAMASETVAALLEEAKEDLAELKHTVEGAAGQAKAGAAELGEKIAARAQKLAGEAREELAELKQGIAAVETVPHAKAKPAADAIPKPFIDLGVETSAIQVVDQPRGIQMPSQETINKLVEEAAYSLAEKRDFAPGFEEEDWEAAREQIMAWLADATRQTR